MRWLTLESKMLSAVAYDGSKQLLYLRFRNTGDVYRYFISRLPNIRPSWEPNRRAGFSAFKSAITSVTNAWPNSTPPDFVRRVRSCPPHLCGEDLSNPSTDSERLVRCGPPELRKTG